MNEREQAIKQICDLLAGELDERTRRLVAGSEAITIGWGDFADQLCDQDLPQVRQSRDQRTQGAPREASREQEAHSSLRR
jgi:hypothetical protein